MNEYQQRRKLNQAFLNAAETGDVELARALLAQGADLKVINDSQDRNALHLACAKGHVPMVAFLIGVGANDNDRDDQGDAPIHLAACHNHPRVLHLMVHLGCDIELRNMLGGLPIWETQQAKNYDAFSAMLDLGGLVNEYWNREYSHVRNEARVNELVDFQVLLKEYDAVADAIEAAAGGQELKDYLLTANPETGRFPLESAAAWQSLPHIFTVLENANAPFTKSELSTPFSSGRTPLIRAAECHQLPRIAQHLAAHGSPLQPEDLIDPATLQPTQLLSAIQKTCQLEVAMDLARSFEDAPRSVRRVLDVIDPQERQWQVPNAHSLMLEITRNQQQQAQQRG